MHPVAVVQRSPKLTGGSSEHGGTNVERHTRSVMSEENGGQLTTLRYDVTLWRHTAYDDLSLHTCLVSV